MADVTISYKGSSIATMDASGTKTLETEGKYCEDDISVVYVKPAGPSGTKTINISANGTTTEDVADYASAEIVANVNTKRSATTTVANSTYIQFSLSNIGSWRALEVRLQTSNGSSHLKDLVAGNLTNVGGAKYNNGAAQKREYVVRTEDIGSDYANIVVTSSYVKVYRPTTNSNSFTTGEKYSLTVYY